MKGLFYATSMVAMAAVITSCGNGGAKKAAAEAAAFYVRIGLSSAR